MFLNNALMIEGLLFSRAGTLLLVYIAVRANDNTMKLNL